MKQLALVDTPQCEHDLTEPVFSAGGEVIGRQCSSCLEVLAGHGQCNWCGAIGQLVRYVGTTGARYCSDDCRLNQRRWENAQDHLITIPKGAWLEGSAYQAGDRRTVRK